jgi:ketosteroid isomerase-like protein
LTFPPAHIKLRPANQARIQIPKNSIGEIKMKKFAGALLLICASVGLVYAQTTKPAAKPAGPSVSDSVKQLERDWSEAMKAKDADKLDQLIADDWTSIGPDGVKSTKKEYLASIKNGEFVLTSFEFGPMEVKVIGSTATVQGSDTEKSTTKGKDSSGKYVWMDVFANRGGKWQAVRSQVAMVK